jgi:hypothetical protein
VKRIFKVHQRFYCSTPVVQAGNEAIGLWTLAGSWVASQDEPTIPPVPESVLNSWSRSSERIAAKLVAVGLWETSPVHLHDEVFERAWAFVPADDLYMVEARPAWRPEIPPALRQRVYQRDGYACLWCGATESLSLDHIHPYSLGGPDTYANLQTLCTPCNSSKGARV